MKKIHCLNPIAECGTKLFPEDYVFTDQAAEADAPPGEKRFHA